MAESDALRQRTAEAFRAWRDKLARALEAGGLSEADAGSTAILLLAASEGAVVFCRAEQDIRPFDLIVAQLVDHVRALTAAGPAAGRGMDARA